MSAVLLRPQPLPLDGMRPGVGLLVLALHVGLLWVANLYWPLQSVLLGAVQDAAQNITVQILRKNTEVNAPADKPALNANPQAISNPGRQRFGRAEAMLELPAAQLEASTPLAATQQAVQTARALQTLPARPVVAGAAAPDTQPKPNVAPPDLPVPQAAATFEPQPAAVRTVDEKLPTAAAVPSPPPPPVLTLPSALVLPVAPIAPIAPVAPVAPASPVAAAAPLAAPAASVPIASAAVATVPAFSASTATTVPSASNPGAATASGAAQASGTGTGAGAVVPGPASAAAPVVPLTVAPGVGSALNLSLPPRLIYRPPMAVPRRSLSEMANDQLRRKPRDAFAEGMESAGNIDCLKDTPEGPAQGLLAIGPLLKRAIEEKCRK